jgi:hypothetical protein
MISSYVTSKMDSTSINAGIQTRFASEIGAGSSVQYNHDQTESKTANKSKAISIF